MTTIIGVEYKDKSVIVADSRITDDSGKAYSHPFMRKISSRGALLIAGAGEVSPCDIAQNIWIPPVFAGLMGIFGLWLGYGLVGRFL